MCVYFGGSYHLNQAWPEIIWAQKQQGEKKHLSFAQETETMFPSCIYFKIDRIIKTAKLPQSYFTNHIPHHLMCLYFSWNLDLSTILFPPPNVPKMPCPPNLHPPCWHQESSLSATLTTSNFALIIIFHLRYYNPFYLPSSLLTC